MGGGGTMRAADKVAGFCLANGGLRGAPLATPTEQSFRIAKPSVSAIGTSKAAEVKPVNASVSWDVEGWELGDDLFVEAGERIPRVVFGGAPTLVEAKEATAELKEAVDRCHRFYNFHGTMIVMYCLELSLRVYLSSDFAGEMGSSAGNQTSGLSLLSYNSESNAKSPMVPVSNPVLQAFKLLKSPEAQNVVESIACDPTVWNAVYSNPAVKDFFSSQQTNAAGLQAEESSREVEELSESDYDGKNKAGKGVIDDIMGIVQNVKLSVAEMVSNVSNFLQNIFGFSGASPDANGNAKSDNIMDMAFGASFMGLAVLVIMVILLKRF